MSSDQNLQDPFLGALKQSETQISIFLMSGIKLHGVIEHYDDSVVMLKNGITQMIYKHAISTVVPSEAIDYNLRF